MSLLFPASTKMLTAIARNFPFLDFWSAPIDKITVTDTAVDIDFGFVIVTGLPSGFTIKKVETIMTCRAIKDTSGANNKINANNRAIRVMKAGGVWGVDDVVGIYLVQDSLFCAASAKEAGPVIIGWPDIRNEVDDNDIYHIMSDQTQRSDALVALGNGLELYDVQIGLRIFFS